jgi:hypothetical protein
MIVHLNHVLRFTFSECQWYNRLKCIVKKIVSDVCLSLSFEIYLKNPIRLTIIHVHKLSSYFFFIIPVIFIDAFPLLFAIFHYLGGGQSFTFNRFATNFCYFQQFVVDFLLLTDFSLFFHIFHYIS